MSSQKVQNFTETSEVSKFYKGKSLFITGAAGFLGAILLETLLRCCPDIRKIYILLRSKKGVEPEDRLKKIFEKEIFYKLKETDPDVLQKVVVISGDVTKENLGMCEDDLVKIIEEVSIVFHCAATISFLKPLSFTIQHNVMGSYNVIELCRKLQKLEVMVYTSTAFSNSNRKYIEEKVYKLPFEAEEVVKKNGNEELLNSLYKSCHPQFPNYYTFSKCVVENLISEKASDLPICIVRPSLIICSIRGILPGYVEYGSGLVTFVMGVGHGFLRVIRLDTEKKLDQIPVDVVANTHIIAAYHQISQRLPSSYIYNCISSEVFPFTWGQFVTLLLDMSNANPLPTSLQAPSITLCKSSAAYWFFSLIDHYIPAIIFDIFLWISGSKLRLFKLYKFYDRNLKVLVHFTLNEWKFSCDNFLSLAGNLNVADAEIFSVSADFDINELKKTIPANAPMYNRKLKKPYQPIKKPFFYYINIGSMIKWLILGGITSASYYMMY